MTAPAEQRIAAAMPHLNQARKAHCTCYDPDLAEFYGDEPCPICKAIDTLEGSEQP